ncbi:MAG TPA: arginase family protein, partial [Actinomycetota bacterium]|nr:arginase family protein [Actinomycetota bacterium]
MKKRRKVSVIGAAMDLGSARRGVDMGPSAIRCAHLSARLDELGFDVEDLANIESEMAENAPVGDASARYLQAILDACALLAKRIEEALGVGSIPLVLGGDHSIAMGSLAGLANAGGPGGVLWIDAHGDLNTPATTPSGN